jgi:hypothetical protein
VTCIHLQSLYKFCQEQDLKLSGSDLIRVVCRQCGGQEVCPSTLTVKMKPNSRNRLSVRRRI